MELYHIFIFINLSFIILVFIHHFETRRLSDIIILQKNGISPRIIEFCILATDYMLKYWHFYLLHTETFVKTNDELFSR
jgi:hypothetical protein